MQVPSERKGVFLRKNGGLFWSASFFSIRRFWARLMAFSGGGCGRFRPLENGLIRVGSKRGFSS
jgi:hypothetical protein